MYKHIPHLNLEWMMSKYLNLEDTEYLSQVKRKERLKKLERILNDKI